MKRVKLANRFIVKYVFMAILLTMGGAYALLQAEYELPRKDVHAFYLAHHQYREPADEQTAQEYLKSILERQRLMAFSCFGLSALALLRLCFMRLSCVKYDERSFKRWFIRHNYDDLIYVAINRWEFFGLLKFYLRGGRAFTLVSRHFEGLDEFADTLYQATDNGYGKAYTEESMEFINRDRTSIIWPMIERVLTSRDFLIFTALALLLAVLFLFWATFA